MGPDTNREHPSRNPIPVFKEIHDTTPKEFPSSPNLLKTTDDESLVGEKAIEQQTKGKGIVQEE